MSVVQKCGALYLDKDICKSTENDLELSLRVRYIAVAGISLMIFCFFQMNAAIFDKKTYPNQSNGALEPKVLLKRKIKEEKKRKNAMHRHRSNYTKHLTTLRITYT